MTEPKTFAQKRLEKLIQSYKDAKKLKLASRAAALKSYQQSGSVNERNNSSSILKNLNENGLSSSNSGLERHQSVSAKCIASSQLSLKSRKPQNLSNKSKILESGMKQPIDKSLNPSPITNKEAALKRQKNVKQYNANGGNEKCQKTLPQATPKRRIDHENLERKKIAKNQKYEDSSKNIVDKKSKNELSKGTNANTFGAKLSFIVDSYSALVPDSPPSHKDTKNKAGTNYYPVKESSYNNNNNRNNTKFSIINKKDTDIRVKEKEREIKDKGRMKLPSIPSPSKSKLQTRLMKLKADLKEKREQKGINKESSNDKVDVTKNDDSYFSESMDWEPSNDLILRSIRYQVDPSEEIMEWQDIPNSGYSNVQEISDSNLYIVIDTNVLIKNIELLYRLSKAVIRGFKVIQVIPWQVLKELDNLKAKDDYKSVSIYARKAIRFLSEATNSDQFNVVFQSQSNHFKESLAQFVVEVPDDHLIKCCIQLKEKSHKVLLLSNDVNLRVKTNTNNIQAVDDLWIEKLLDQETKSRKLSIHCFETKPKECQRGCDNDNSSHFVHRTTEVILSSFYNIVIFKYQEKYDDLWPLWVPKEPHFPDLINFMTSSAYFQPHWVKINTIKDFFIKKKSYDDTKPADIEKLGRNFVSLVKSMCNEGFIPNDLALNFFKNLRFLKCFPVLDGSDFNYIEWSYRLAQKYLKNIEDSLNEFVTYVINLYAEKGSLLHRNEDLLHHIDLNLKLINTFSSAFSQFNMSQEISEDSEIAKALHKAICEFLGEKIDFSKFPIFSPEDIVEYVNPNR
ncbi:transcriptional protein SWT1 isoform X2 [Halyomorpha halys]|nr:transcriptional protein SWT1 isoform X2 [Halyomorpha halys]